MKKYVALLILVLVFLPMIGCVTYPTQSQVPLGINFQEVQGLTQLRLISQTQQYSQYRCEMQEETNWIIKKRFPMLLTFDQNDSMIKIEYDAVEAQRRATVAAGYLASQSK